jgi:hypothetical protein
MGKVNAYIQRRLDFSCPANALSLSAMMVIVLSKYGRNSVVASVAMSACLLATFLMKVIWEIRSTSVTNVPLVVASTSS